MQCYNYEVLCRTLVACAKERYPNIDFELLVAVKVHRWILRLQEGNDLLAYRCIFYRHSLYMQRIRGKR